MSAPSDPAAGVSPRPAFAEGDAAPPPGRPGLLRRLLPRPWTVLWIWLAWLLLNQSAAPGHLLLGLVLGLVLARFPAVPTAAHLRDPGGHAAWQRPHRLLRLFAIVLWDIVVANVQVAMLILGSAETLRSSFVWVPLDVRRPKSITLLAGIITMTPGTVSAELSDDHLHLLVHALDVDDPAALIAQIKARYETPIKELFE
jgi:multicomponent K+:H+ antiporter subunit E